MLQDTFIEFCNTSLQVHLQVGAKGVRESLQLGTGHCGAGLASAVNSPLLLNHRLVARNAARVVSACHGHALSDPPGKKSDAEGELRRPMGDGLDPRCAA